MKFRNRVARFGSTLIVAASLLGPAAAADTGPASRLSTPDRAVAAGRARPSEQPASQAGDDQVLLMEPLAAKALIDAKALIEAGARGKGQRQLELLIARYPETRAADASRKLLAELYAVAGARTADQPRADAEAARAEDTSQSGHGALLSPLDRIAARTLQEEFRLTNGDRIFFPNGSAEFGSRARLVIAAQLQWLLRHPTARVVVEGHADDTVNPAELRRLASERANGVRDRLIAGGIEPGRIVVRSFDDTQRIALCPEPACTAQNRRAVVAVEDRGTTRNPSRAGSIGRGITPVVR